MYEPSPKPVVSSLGSRTSVLNISHPVVSIYTHRHTIENFKILNFFAFDSHHWRAVGFWLRFLVPLGAHTCALGCTYLYLVGVRTCSGPFRSISKHQKCSRSDALLETAFLTSSRKNEFWTFLPPMKTSKMRFLRLSTELPGCLWSPKYAQKWLKSAPKVPEGPK